jgi:hypothetical protein
MRPMSRRKQKAGKLIEDALAKGGSFIEALQVGVMTQ